MPLTVLVVDETKFVVGKDVPVSEFESPMDDGTCDKEEDGEVGVCDAEPADTEEAEDAVCEEGVAETVLSCEELAADDELVRLPGMVIAVEAPALDDAAVDVDCGKDGEVVEMDTDGEADVPTTDDSCEEAEAPDAKVLPDIP